VSTRPVEFAWLPRCPDPPAATSFVLWFEQLAAFLLKSCRLVVAGQPHRLVEIEFYYHGPGHYDPFTHCDAMQARFGHWYFHRTGGQYRGGSFKGLDLTIGDGPAHGGVLLRGLETPDGQRVEGPSLLVDHLLKLTREAKVAALDATLAARPVWDQNSVLHLGPLPAPEARPIYRSARVGLSLRTATIDSERPLFVLQPYRFLTEPKRTSKGKLLLALALHAQGLPAAEIQRLTGCPRPSLERYRADFDAGRLEKDFHAYLGREWNARDLGRLHGTWHAKWGRPFHES